MRHTGGWAIVCLALIGAARADSMRQSDVFAAGRGGYHTYRIPSLVVTPKGTLVALAEGRRKGAGDAGDIDVVCRRSADGGMTWSDVSPVWDDGPNTVGNPCPVVAADGRIVLLLTRNLGEDTEAEIIANKSRQTRSVWVCESRDDGVSWTKPAQITKQVKLDDWTWYATGPGAGIRLKSGRLLVPCDHIRAGSREMRSHVIVSDDGGVTWTRGGDTGPGCNECEAVELADGRVLLNMRSYQRSTAKVRAVADSADGGMSFSAPRPDAGLPCPVCQASVRRWTGKPGRGRVAFSNPASDGKRDRLTVRLSYDECRTWPVARELHAGPAAYSCLAALPDGRMACLYECGERSPYERLRLATFDLAWLTGGRDALP